MNSSLVDFQTKYQIYHVDIYYICIYAIYLYILMSYDHHSKGGGGRELNWFPKKRFQYLFIFLVFIRFVSFLFFFWLFL